MSSIIYKIRARILNPRLLLLDLFNFIAPKLNDISFLKLRYWIVMGKKLDLKNPKTYNEKLQWLKLYDRRPIYTTFVDKYAVKKYVSDLIGSEYVIPTLGVWNDPSEIDFTLLPDQYVLKTTHDGDSLGVFICKDNETFDRNLACEKIAKNLRRNYYLPGREWPYKDVPPRIIAEKYVEDESGELRDYKFFCFDGKVKALFVATERTSGHVKFDYYDREFNHLDFIQSHPMSGKAINKPKNYELMVELAEKLSAGYPHIRVDLYNFDGRIYFGELTLYHCGGMIAFHPEKWDYTFGEWLTLPHKQVESNS